MNAMGLKADQADFAKALEEMQGQTYEMTYRDRDQEAKEELAKKKKQEIENAPVPETGFRVNLKNDDGLGYVGVLAVGSEQRPVKVLFDTGSDYLAITSSLCDDPNLGQ